MSAALYVLGILAQAIAAVAAFAQVRYAPMRLPWLLIASSSLLIVFRRAATLREFTAADRPLAAAEFLTLVISLLFLAGVLLMSRVFRQTMAAQADAAHVRTLLDTTEQLGHIGGWEWDVDTRTMTWTDETYRIHGFAPGGIAEKSDDLVARSIACYAPADRPVIDAAFRRCVETGEPYELTCGLTTLDGREIWINTIGRADMVGTRVVRLRGHIVDVTARVEAERALQQKVGELSRALEQVRTLRGIVPICASCKKIRNDEGYWQQVESYVREHTEAEFSHGLCPDCADRLYPELPRTPVATR